MIRRFLIPLFIICFSLVIAIVASEVGLRLWQFSSLTIPEVQSLFGYRIPHKTRGWSLKPNISADIQHPAYNVLVRTNSKGFRDIERSYEASNERTRILVLGDSYMEGYQIPLDDMFSRVLENMLGEDQVEVLNLGVGGYGTGQALLTLQEEGVKYSPDIIILAFYLHNDIRNNSHDLEWALRGSNSAKVFARPFASVAEDGSLTFSEPDLKRFQEYVDKKISQPTKKLWIYRSTLLGRLIEKSLEERTVLGVIDGGYDANIHFGPALTNFLPAYGKGELSEADYQKIWHEGWQLTKRLLEEMSAIAKKQNALFAVMPVPMELEYNDRRLKEVQDAFPDFIIDRDRPSQKLQEILPPNTLYLDTLPAFRDHYTKGRDPLTFQPYDRHWNSQGHAQAAQAATPLLIKGNTFLF